MQSSPFFSLVTRGFVSAALITLFATSSAARAQEPAVNRAPTAVQFAPPDAHLVSPAQLDRRLQESTVTRQKQVEGLTQFLSTPQAEKAMRDAKIDPVQVKTAIPTLSNAELADLSARADRAQHDFAAGGLGTLAIALIILAIVLVILLAVYH